MKKEIVLDMMKEFPQEFELEDLIEQLILKDKIEKGLSQLDQNKTITHKEVKELIKKW